jgi:hypothetical protein
MPGPTIYNDGWCAKCADAPRAGKSAYCRDCWNAYQREYKKRLYRTNHVYRAKAITKNRERLYGLTEDRYTELWAQQGGVCAICLQEGETRGLGVDHDHETGAVRGLLCGSCNRAIGMLQERADLMQRATEYLAIFA